MYSNEVTVPPFVLTLELNTSTSHLLPEVTVFVVPLWVK